MALYRTYNSGYLHDPLVWNNDCWAFDENSGPGGAYLVCNDNNAFNPSGSFSVFVIFKQNPTSLSTEQDNIYLFDTDHYDEYQRSFEGIVSKPGVWEFGIAKHTNQDPDDAPTCGDGAADTNSIIGRVYGIGTQQDFGTVGSPDLKYHGKVRSNMNSNHTVFPISAAYVEERHMIALIYDSSANTLTIRDSRGSSYTVTESVSAGTIASTTSPLVLGKYIQARGSALNYTSKLYRFGYLDGTALSESQFDTLVTVMNQENDALYTQMISLNADVYINFDQTVGGSVTPDIGTPTFTVTTSSGSIYGPSVPTFTSNELIISSGNTVKVNQSVTLPSVTGLPDLRWESHGYDVSGSYATTVSNPSPPPTCVADSIPFSYNTRDTAFYTYDAFMEGSNGSERNGYKLEAENIGLRIYGTLVFEESPILDEVTYQFGGNIVVRGGSLVVRGSDGGEVPANKKVNIICKDSMVFWNLGQVQFKGQTSYHMADAAKQRTLLNSDVTAGSDVQIQMQDDVDWEVGDTIWLSYGGDKTVEFWTDTGANLGSPHGYGSEQVTLKTKVNASTYTVDLTYNHSANDMVIHGDRNIVVDSENSTAGYVFTTCNTTSQQPWRRQLTDITYDNGYQYTWDEDAYWRDYPTFDAAWTSFKRGGGVIDVLPGVFCFEGAQIVSNDEFKLKNCLVDNVYSSGANAITHEGANNDFLILDVTQQDIDELHCYGTEHVVEGDSATFGHLTVGHISAIGSDQGCIKVLYQMTADSVWFNQADPVVDSTHNIIQAGSIKVGSLKAHMTNTGIVLSETDTQYMYPGVVLFDDIELYHCRTYAGRFNGEALDVYISNADIYDTIDHGFVSDGLFSHRITIVDSIFNKCNRSKDSTAGCLRLNSSSSGGAGQHNVLVRNCEFGTLLQNGVTAISVGAGIDRSTHGRIILEGCKFKETLYSVVPDYYEWGSVMGWIVYPQSYANSTRRQWNRGRTLELVNPIVYNSSDIDQWPISYSGVSHLAVVGGGGEVRNLSPAEQIDGKGAMWLSPFATYTDCAGNAAVPYKLSVPANKLISARLYLKKNISMPSGRRPKVFMRGVGIDAETEMSDVIDSWEEINLSGTSAVQGIVYLWVTGGYNERDTAGDDILSEKTLGTIQVFVDSVLIEVAD